MDISKIAIGENPPSDVNVIIEVPLGGEPIKYEIDKASGAMFVDRYLYTPMRYPCNYGFVPHTLSEDGDPMDVMCVGNRALVPGAVLRARPVGVLFMEDEKGLDEKIIAVPHPKLTRYYDKIENYTCLPDILVERITHFFEHYKDLEPNKWVKIVGWGDVNKAHEVIVESIDRLSGRPSRAAS
ncbi:MAG: inorganic diphosphatase [Caulobacterales bacterium]|nr:inorganic diphosphatase [Caulobacterales bacterium]